ncbi:MAG TPA: SDR family NAD(P)-dependent oxidoreductase [Candidatus Nanoarchaeia archaeon]|nr:SDR family NAD(P)-dependent oxidoreductase [Candidatus Nanoarchaeia archaeon]
MSNILVTGGAGFIGSNLILLLLRNDYHVTVLDNLSTGKMENLQELKKNPNFRFILGDIRSQENVNAALEGIDAVVHLAALIDVSASVAEPLFTHDVNVTGTLNMLQEAARRRVERFVFASSTAVYGDTKTLPVTEETPFQPISPYAASKAAAEAYCSTYAGCYGLNTVRLRFFNVYGPKNENSPYSGVITKFLQKAQSNQTLTIEGDGEQTRDFIHVSDIAQALMAALKGKNLQGDVFNVCTGKPTSINTLASTLSAVLGKNLKTVHAQARVGDIRYSYGDPSKAERGLRFRAKVDIAEGLKLLLKKA